MTFMHGSTGQWEMYNDNLNHFASHGFAVLFPFIKSPQKDKNPLTTNTDGKYLLKAIEFARAANADPTSPLYGIVDMDNIVIAGHSMGATCSIMASKTLPKGVKASIAQHPGICGPFGPPPSPDTWLKKDLNTLTANLPMLFTTATNDGAFWPAPQTAKHEYGCFEAGVNENAQAAFVQFSADACKEDDDRKPFPDGGHNCPLKKIDAGRPEMWWVLTMLKLYGQ
jgi:dienelactone hydrolase